MRRIVTSGDFCNATEGVSGSASAILVASSPGGTPTVSENEWWLLFSDDPRLVDRGIDALRIDFRKLDFS